MKPKNGVGHVTTSVISCSRSLSATRPCLPATAQRWCGRFQRSYGKEKNTPCELKASATLNTLFSLIDDGFKSTYTLICLQFQLSFSKFASTVKSQS